MSAPQIGQPDGKTSSNWDDIGMRKTIADRVSQMGDAEHEQVLRIVRTHGVRYTVNGNGIFCDITAAPPAMMDDISAFLDYCDSNRSTILSEPAPRAPDAYVTYQRSRDRLATRSKDRLQPARHAAEVGSAKRKESLKYQYFKRKYSREASARGGDDLDIEQ